MYLPNVLIGLVLGSMLELAGLELSDPLFWILVASGTLIYPLLRILVNPTGKE